VSGRLTPTRFRGNPGRSGASPSGWGASKTTPCSDIFRGLGHCGSFAMPFSFIHCPYGGRCSSPRLPAGDAAGGPLARPEGAGRLIPHLVRRGSHNALWCVGCWPCSIPRAGCGVESLHTHEPLPGWRSCTPRAVGAGPGCGCCSCWGFSVPSPPDAARAPPTRRGTAPSLIPHLVQQAPQQARVQPLG